MTTLQMKNYKFFVMGGIVFTVALIILFSSNPNEYFPESFEEKRFEIFEPDFENNENVKMLPQKNLNKNTAQNSSFGFPVDIHMNVLEATNSQEKFSIRFTSKYSGGVSNILLPLQAQLDDEIKVGLQESIEGRPSGTWLSSGMAYHYPNDLPSTDVFAINFTQNIPIESGKIYHIVIEPTIKQNNPPVVLKVYNGNWKINPLNQTDPDNTWSDPLINTLFFDGESWLTLDRWPSFVIKYSDGISDGQPYTLFAPWVIEGKRYVGQAVIPYSSYTVNDIGFVTNIKNNPTDDLYFAIYDSDNNILREGIYAKKEDLKNTPRWWSKNITPPITFESGNLYRVVLFSPNSTLEDGYFVYGYEFMLDKTLGYGSTIHHLTASFDGSETWREWYDADASFWFITEN